MPSIWLSRREWLAIAILSVQQSGCGTIFWPERRGQPPGRLDPKVVALDAIGLLLFFIPGVIAFAVDFSNGTIYLPPGEYSSTGSPGRWTTVQTAGREITPDEIEHVVQSQTGKEVRLRPGAYRACKLETVAALDELNIDETELGVACEASQVRFRSQSE